MPASRPRRKVCAVLVDRANYGRLKPVLRAIARCADLELQVLATGTMVLERFGSAANVVRQDGFEIHAEVYVELEGSTPATMAKSVGLGVMELSSAFQRLDPDVVMLIGDRYEAFAAAIAAAYMNRCIVHLQGGEVSGSIDESARHAISKLSHFHFPSTRRAARYLERMGERSETILAVGCPSSDLARELDRTLPADLLDQRGSGATIDVGRPFLLVIFHPTTTEYGSETEQVEALLSALDELRRPTVILWPNIDAGSDHIAKRIRIFRQRTEGGGWLHTLTNLPPEDYLKVLANAACAIGNSSSFVRDAGYFGTPVVLVGGRQDGRERDAHAVQVAAEAEPIVKAVNAQLAHGRYAPSTLYGDGHVSERIALALTRLTPYVQKRLAYVGEDTP